MGSYTGDVSYYASGPNSTTACGETFDANQVFAAWPALTGFPGNPASSCMNTSLSCGSTITVQNLCTGRYGPGIPIWDHAGAGVDCTPEPLTACSCAALAHELRILDLSLGAFQACAGSLTYGHFPAKITF